MVAWCTGFCRRGSATGRITRCAITSFHQSQTALPVFAQIPSSACLACDILPCTIGRAQLSKGSAIVMSGLFAMTRSTRSRTASTALYFLSTIEETDVVVSSKSTLDTMKLKRNGKVTWAVFKYCLSFSPTYTSHFAPWRWPSGPWFTDGSGVRVPKKV